MAVSGNDLLITGGTFIQNNRIEGPELIDAGMQKLYQHISKDALHDSRQRLKEVNHRTVTDILHYWKSQHRHEGPGGHPSSTSLFDRLIVKTVLDDILAWSNDQSTSRKIMWVNGPSRAQTSLIAQAMVDILYKRVGLSAAFFFPTATTDPSTIIPTISFQLASNIPQIRPQITAAVRNDLAVFDRTMEAQMTKLVVEPLSRGSEQCLDVVTTPNLILLHAIENYSDDNDSLWSLLDIFAKALKSLEGVSFCQRLLVIGKHCNHVDECFSRSTWSDIVQKFSISQHELYREQDAIRRNEEELRKREGEIAKREEDLERKESEHSRWIRKWEEDIRMKEEESRQRISKREQEIRKKEEELRLQQEELEQRSSSLSVCERELRRREEKVVIPLFEEPSPIDPDTDDPSGALDILRELDHDHFLTVVKTIRKWQKQCKEYRELSKGKISFRNFAKGDLALFLPTRNSVSKPWAAFNVSFPHYMLQANDHLAEQLKSREWIVARITSLTERVVDQKDPKSNPFGLGDGVKYYMLEVEDWTRSSQRFPTTSITRVDIRGYSESRMASSSSQNTVTVGPSQPTPTATTTLASLANSWGMSFGRKKKVDLGVGMLTPPVESPGDGNST